MSWTLVPLLGSGISYWTDLKGLHTSQVGSWGSSGHTGTATSLGCSVFCLGCPGSGFEQWRDAWCEVGWVLWGGSRKVFVIFGSVWLGEMIWDQDLSCRRGHFCFSTIAVERLMYMHIELYVYIYRHIRIYVSMHNMIFYIQVRTYHISCYFITRVRNGAPPPPQKKSIHTKYTYTYVLYTVLTKNLYFIFLFPSSFLILPHIFV